MALKFKKKILIHPQLHNLVKKFLSGNINTSLRMYKMFLFEFIQLAPFNQWSFTPCDNCMHQAAFCVNHVCDYMKLPVDGEGKAKTLIVKTY